MIFLSFFIILLVCYAITFTTIYFKLNKQVDNTIKVILNKSQAKADFCNNFSELNSILTHIQKNITNNLIVIFIIPLITYLLFTIVIRKHDLEDAKNPIYIMFIIKIVFCGIMLYVNSLNKDTYDLTHLYDIIEERTELNGLLKRYVDDIKQIQKQIYINYKIVYSIELVFTFIFIGVLYKYDDILELLNLD